MIGQLSGKVITRDTGQLLLDVAGVGYELLISERTSRALPRPGQPAKLLVHTHVREDRIQLFGFSDILEKRAFEMLLAVSGVGVKLALALLSQIRPEECLAAIVHEDTRRLSSVVGLGKKTAQRLVLELKEKAKKELAGLALSELPTQSSLPAEVRRDLASALANLGYHKNEIDLVLAKLPATAAAEFEGALRASLKLLSAPATGGGYS